MAGSGARLVVAVLAAGSFLLVAHRGAAAANGRGAQLAAMCASCHRLDGRDEGNPSIAGLAGKSLADTMTAFRSGERSSQIMHAVARSLDDEEIAALADYLATQDKGPDRP